MTDPTDPPTVWSCLACSWTSTRLPGHVVVLFHKCRPDGVRRRLVELTPLDDDSPQDRRRAETRSWYLSQYPRPPDPAGNREPRPATRPRPEEPPR